MKTIVKLSVIMPTCETPIGSGRPHCFFKQAIESVLNGGHDDFELLVGADGKSDVIRDIAESFKDKRIKLTEFPETRTWGNHQRHELMKVSTGDYTCFLDHDDAYVPGGLKLIADEIDTFPGKMFIFRVKLRSNVVVWVNHSIKTQRNVAGHAVLAPRTGYPLWRGSSDRLEDLHYVTACYDHCTVDLHEMPIWVPVVIVNIRPWAPPERLDLFSKIADGTLATC